ncbi:hypothetical protein M3P05_06175 [Sansalvadorimonas sp. 2012CJ34-2]|uniref:Uncharacterized protein n=1 Tax=Parendozoicomonas callyspongiae TaxID=2942213 RepID=A0ABT0PE50_9GAMM|nr:hypothetical protein [Sansalvadorimonas sp. 2012CJ34-2]MCL6269526.1 hypothetical protein [Sansalvadorimonas sp. 2012CJ34-2]
MESTSQTSSLNSQPPESPSSLLTGLREPLSPGRTTPFKSEHPNVDSDKNILEREIERSDSPEITLSTSQSNPMLDKDVDKAQDYIDSLSGGMKYQFRQSGLDANRLAPVCKALRGNCTRDQIRLALDQILNEVVACPEANDLKHNGVIKSALGVIALVGNGANRWFGLEGLSKILPGAPSAKLPLAKAITTFAYVSDGLQGAYGSNRVKLEGFVNHWTGICSGVAAFASAAVISGMAYRGILALGAGTAAAASIALTKLIGSFPFYNILMERSSHSWQGGDHIKEARVERSVWLLSETLRWLGPKISLGNNDDMVRQRAFAYSKTMRLTPHEARLKRLLSWFCLYSPGNKAKNVIKELQSYKNEKAQDEKDLSLRVIESEAATSRSSWGWPCVVAGFGLTALFTGLSSWGEATSAINPLINASVTGSCLTGLGVYIGWQLILTALMAGRSLGQAALVKDNMLMFKDKIVKLATNFRNCSRRQIKSLYDNCTIRKLLETSGKAGFLVLGIISSICYTFSFAGAITTNVHDDFCLGNDHVLPVVLAVLGSLPMLVATIKLGSELEEVAKACILAIKRAGLWCGRCIKTRCCKHPKEKTIPWYKAVLKLQPKEGKKSLTTSFSTSPVHTVQAHQTSVSESEDEGTSHETEVRPLLKASPQQNNPAFDRVSTIATQYQKLLNTMVPAVP